MNSLELSRRDLLGGVAGLGAGMLVSKAADAQQSTLPAFGARADTPGGPATVTFADDFDDGLDRTKWSTNYTNVLASLPEELQIFTPDNFDAAPGGILRIRTDRRNISGFRYTSGAMTTYGAFAQAYGYFEIRAKLPRGKGLWPGFWMLPEDKGWPPEIDIVEFLGGDVATMYTTYHWTDDKQQHQKDGEGIKSDDWTRDFHRYGLVWKPEFLAWYVDGKEVKRLTGAHVPKTPMFMLVETTVGGSWGGPPNPLTPFPSYFDVDYVRAYQFDDMPQPPVREYKNLISIVSKHVAKPGDPIEVDLGIETAKPNEILRLQPILYDITGKKQIARMNFDLPASGPGKIRRKWVFRLPADLPSGLYVISIGLFDANWKQLDWLNNSTTILVNN